MSEDDDFLTGDSVDSMLELTGAPKETLKLRNIQEEVKSNPSIFLNALEILAEGVRSKQIDKAELQKLANLLPPDLFYIDKVDTDFDIKEELGQQMSMVASMRLAVLNPGGRGLREGVSIGDAKAVMESCRAFSETIRKNMERFNNISRVQALEAAVLETISSYQEDFKREFLKNLEESLKVYCKNEE